jgi:ribulose 1,5-bisphosphate carboxylase large subunit-like protein
MREALITILLIQLVVALHTGEEEDMTGVLVVHLAQVVAEVQEVMEVMAVSHQVGPVVLVFLIHLGLDLTKLMVLAEKEDFKVVLEPIHQDRLGQIILEMAVAVEPVQLQ